MCCVNLKSRDTHLNIQCMQCPTDSIYTYLCIGKHCACCMTGLARSHSQILYTYCRVSPYEGTDDGGIHVKLRFVKNESTTDTVPVKKKHRIYIIVITKYSTELQSSVITQHYNVHKNPSNNNYI